MNAKLATTTLIVLSSLVAGTSFAGNTSAMPQVGDYDVVRVSPTASTLTREAVQAEYQAAKLAGVLPQAGDADVAYAKAAPTSLTREAVKAEYLAARETGNLPRAGDQI
jgi:hypothetical protein